MRRSTSSTRSAGRSDRGRRGSICLTSRSKRRTIKRGSERTLNSGWASCVSASPQRQTQEEARRAHLAVALRLALRQAPPLPPTVPFPIWADLARESHLAPHLEPRVPLDRAPRGKRALSALLARAAAPTDLLLKPPCDLCPRPKVHIERHTLDTRLSTPERLTQGPAQRVRTPERERLGVKGPEGEFEPAERAETWEELDDAAEDGREVRAGEEQREGREAAGGAEKEGLEGGEGEVIADEGDVLDDGRIEEREVRRDEGLGCELVAFVGLEFLDREPHVTRAEGRQEVRKRGELKPLHKADRQGDAPLCACEPLQRIEEARRVDRRGRDGRVDVEVGDVGHTMGALQLRQERVGHLGCRREDEPVEAVEDLQHALEVHDERPRLVALANDEVQLPDMRRHPLFGEYALEQLGVAVEADDDVAPDEVAPCVDEVARYEGYAAADVAACAAD